MTYDLAIIGGGPAGVAAGIYAARKKLKTLFITRDWNTQSIVSPEIENWIGDIKISGVDLSNRLKNHLYAYSKESVDIKENESCLNISDIGAGSTLFSIKTDKSQYESKSVLIVSGSHRRKLDVKGADRLEHKGLTYCASCDGPMYSDMDVVVVGGGNAAFESASQLLAYCKSVTLLNRSDKFRADPITVEAVSKNTKFKIITSAIPKEVLGEKFVTGLIYTDSKTNKDITLNISGIFVEIGALPNTSMVKDLVRLDETNKIIVDPKNQRASLAGIWSAGDCTDGLYHQNNIAAGDGVKALEDIYLFLKTR